MLFPLASNSQACSHDDRMTRGAGIAFVPTSQISTRDGLEPSGQLTRWEKWAAPARTKPEVSPRREPISSKCAVRLRSRSRSSKGAPAATAGGHSAAASSTGDPQSCAGRGTRVTTAGGTSTAAAAGGPAPDCSLAAPFRLLLLLTVCTPGGLHEQQTGGRVTHATIEDAERTRTYSSDMHTGRSPDHIAKIQSVLTTPILYCPSNTHARGCGYMGNHTLHSAGCPEPTSRGDILRNKGEVTQDPERQAVRAEGTPTCCAAR